ncbi:MAG TPA: hypothetical protein VGL62_07610, partial [Vicinamibacterales bacterium]
MIRRFAAALVLCLALIVPLARAQAISRSPLSYSAVIDRGVRDKPPLIHLGPAGFSFNDPVFGSRMWRVTDALTRPDARDLSYRTPSGTHQNAWSADSSHFYVVSTDGSVMLFTLEQALSGSAPIELKFYTEPQFSYVDPDAIYGSFNGAGATLRTIDQYSLSTGKYTQVLDLDSVASGLQGTFVGSVASSGGTPERFVVLFGGIAQDQHHLVVVFDRAQPTNRHAIDSTASTIDGRPTPVPLNFHLHNVMIDRSGRYVMLYPTGPDLVAPRNAAQ